MPNSIRADWGSSVLNPTLLQVLPSVEPALPAASPPELATLTAHSALLESTPTRRLLTNARLAEREPTLMSTVGC